MLVTMLLAVMLTPLLLGSDVVVDIDTFHVHMCLHILCIYVLLVPEVC